MRATIPIVILMCWLTGVHITPAMSQQVAAVAPEFPSGLQWLNTDRPLTLRQLRGKVVLLDFWTYGCLNCLHILPDLHRLEATYAPELVVIGVHSAKYDNEAALANIRQAVRRYDITHPVVNDRDLRILKAYRVPGWPTQIVIDPEGRQLQGFVGENHYSRLDHLIKTTLARHRRKGTLRDNPLPIRVTSEPVQPAALRYPGKVLADMASSRLFIADTHHHRLVVTDFQGNLITVIGNGTVGAHNGSFETATFRQPQGMALHGSLLYVADTGNHLLRRVDLQRRVVETLAGSGDQARVFNVPGTGRAVLLNSPWDLYRHESSLYIAMAGMHQIWHMDLSTAYLEPFSGSGREGLVDEQHTEAALGQPSGLSGHGRLLYIADSEVNALRAASVDPDGTITTLAGGGLFTFGDRDGTGHEARLQHPLGVAYADGLVYVADTYNHKIKVFDPSQGRLRTLAGTGVPGDHNGSFEQAQFYEPGGLSTSPGRLYVADTNNHRVRVLNLVTRTVSTLSVNGLAPPIPASSILRTATRDRGVEVVRLKEQRLAATSRATIRLAFNLPAGWKVNTAAPATLLLNVAGNGMRVPAGYTRQTLQPFDPNLVIPVDVASAGTAAQLRVDLSFVICQVRDQGICALRQVAWDVPIRSQAHAMQSELTLHYKEPHANVVSNP